MSTMRAADVESVYEVRDAEFDAEQEVRAAAAEEDARAEESR